MGRTHRKRKKQIYILAYIITCKASRVPYAIYTYGAAKKKKMYANFGSNKSICKTLTEKRKKEKKNSKVY